MTLGKAPRRGDRRYGYVPNFEDKLHETDSHGFDSNDAGDRPTRERVLLDIASSIASRGTCSRAKVGAVIARDGRIITTGYNGAPAGMPHCDHSTDAPLPPVKAEVIRPLEGKTPKIIELPPKGTMTWETGCTISEHAERNAIAYAARYGLSTDKSDLYCTHGPCLECARVIINAGILRVFYKTLYRLKTGIDLLTSAGVGVFQLNDEGQEVNPWQ